MRFKLEQEDERGEVYSFVLSEDPFQELMLFFTKKGYLRGGHYHNVKEYRVVIQGKAWFTHKSKKVDVGFLSGEGDLIICDSNTTHVMVAKTDCWIMEWWEPNKSTTTDKKARSMVEKCMNK